MPHGKRDGDSSFERDGKRAGRNSSDPRNNWSWALSCSAAVDSVGSWISDRGSWFFLARRSPRLISPDPRSRLRRDRERRSPSSDVVFSQYTLLPLLVVAGQKLPLLIPRYDTGTLRISSRQRDQRRGIRGSYQSPGLDYELNFAARWYLYNAQFGRGGATFV